MCVLFLAVLLALAIEGSAVAQSPTPVSPSPRPGADVELAEDQVMLSGTVAVPRGRAVGEVVVLSGRAIVAGVVAGDVVVLDGPVAISGQVSGSVVAVNGPIRLAATASIGGDVLGAQSVRLAPGALVRGEVRDDVVFTPRGALAALGALLGAVAIAVSALLLLLLLAVIAPRSLDRVATAAHTAPFASVGWGVLLSIALPAIAVAAAVSILGLPLGLSLLLALGLIALVGYALAVFAIGRLIVREPRGRVGALLAGWGTAAAVGLVPFLNVLVWAVGSMFGLGATVVAVWRVRAGRPSRGRHRAGYAPGHAHPPTPARVHAPAPAGSAVPTAPTVVVGEALGPDATGAASETYPATSDD
jgi:cytoskeletal protein CcmA (bactofilin family)